ncbi:MAG: hypothetical protein K2M06_03770 [Muribaculaceae bacterium]|nr:hypothetical protein [Muribaculaceae bacterium]
MLSEKDLRPIGARGAGRAGAWQLAVTVLLLALSLAGAICWQEACYPFGDDYLYRLVPPEGTQRMRPLSEWMPAAREIGSVGDYFSAVRINFMAYSGRLSNFLYFPFGLMPHWADKAVCGIIVFMMLWGMLVAGYSRDARRHPWYVALAITAMWTIFPWDNFMQSSAFVFNYPLATVAVLGFIVLLRGVANYGCVGKAGVVALAFVIGWMHEGFAFCAGAYLVVYALCERPGSRVLWGVVAAGAVGLSVVMYSAVHARMEDWASARVFTTSSMRADSVLVAGVVAPILLGAVMVWFMRKQAGNVEWKRMRGEMFGLLAGAMAGLTMCVVLGMYRRERWPADVFTMLIYLRFAELCLPRLLGFLNRGVLLWGSAFFGVAYGVWLWGLVGWQAEVSEVRAELEAEVAPRYSTDARVVYGRLMAGGSVPWIYMGIPNPMYEANFNGDFFGAYWTGRDDVKFLPREYEGKTFEELPEIPGTAGLRGVYPWLMSDRANPGQLEVHGGELGFMDSPGPWLLSWLKGAVLGRADVIHPFPRFEETRVNDSTVMYRVYLSRPYTFGRRAIERIDTVASGGEEVAK